MAFAGRSGIRRRDTRQAVRRAAIVRQRPKKHRLHLHAAKASKRKKSKMRPHTGKAAKGRRTKIRPHAAKSSQKAPLRKFRRGFFRANNTNCIALRGRACLRGFTESSGGFARDSTSRRCVPRLHMRLVPNFPNSIRRPGGSPRPLRGYASGRFAMNSTSSSRVEKLLPGSALWSITSPGWCSSVSQYSRRHRTPMLSSSSFALRE